MQGIVEALLIPMRGALPHYLEFARRDARGISERFDARLLQLSQFLGDPISDTPTEWYPAAARMACWRCQTKTVCVVLERHNRHGWLGTLLWCLTDEEMEVLLQAQRTRATRIAQLGAFRQHLGEELSRIAKRAPGLALALTRKILIDDLAALGPEEAVSLVAGNLRDADGEIRCEAAELMLRMEAEHGLPYVLPLFDDPLNWVRWNVLGDIARYGDDSVVPTLIKKLRTDTDPGVRGQAAFALGHLGSPEAIPALIAALETDKEVDPLGHSPSSISATALDNILGTDETRIRMDDGFCKLAPWPPDYERLKKRALTLYERWKRGISIQVE
jgi:hypothetical protein